MKFLAISTLCLALVNAAGEPDPTPIQRCDSAKEDDETNLDRVKECSSTEACGDEITGKASNKNCKVPESCGQWEAMIDGKKGEEIGCILTKYCGIKA